MYENSISSSAYEVNMMTFVSGKRRVISSQASIPEEPGRRMSITTTSGCVLLTISMASRAVEACSSDLPFQQGFQSQPDDFMIIYQKNALLAHADSYLHNSRIQLFLLSPEVYKSVPYPAFGQDVFRVGRVLLQLLAQVVDVQTDIVRLVAVLITPHFRQQLVV